MKLYKERTPNTKAQMDKNLHSLKIGCINIWIFIHWYSALKAGLGRNQSPVM